MNYENEYWAMKNHAGLFDYSAAGKIWVSGADRAALLHNMTTQHIKALAPGSGAYAALLKATGQAIADAHVFAFPERFLLLTRPGLSEKITQSLNKYIIMEDVRLEDVSETLGLLGCEGKAAGDFFMTLSGEPLSAWLLFSHKEITLESKTYRVLRFSLSGEDGFYFLTELENINSLRQILLERGRTFSLLPVTDAAINAVRVQAGIPWYGIDFDEKNLFPETGQFHAIHYQKGCYLGQEVIARLDSVAKVQKKLMRLEISGEAVPAAGSAIFKDGKEIGMITSAVTVPDSGKIAALGYVQSACAQPGYTAALRDNAPVNVTLFPYKP